MQNLYDIEKSRDIVDGLISYYKNRIETGRLSCGNDPFIGKIHHNGTFEDCTYGHAIQDIMKNNIELFTSIDSIRAISFGNMVGNEIFGQTGFVHKLQTVYTDIDMLMPLSRRHNLLKEMIDNPSDMFSSWNCMEVIYRYDNGVNIEAFDNILSELRKDELIRNKFIDISSKRVNSMSIILTEKTITASFSYLPK